MCDVIKCIVINGEQYHQHITYFT